MRGSSADECRQGCLGSCHTADRSSLQAASHMPIQLPCGSAAARAMLSECTLPLQVAHQDAIIRREGHVLNAGILAVPAAYDVLDDCPSPDKVYIPAS